MEEGRTRTATCTKLGVWIGEGVDSFLLYPPPNYKQSRISEGFILYWNFLKLLQRISIFPSFIFYPSPYLYLCIAPLRRREKVLTLSMVATRSRMMVVMCKATIPPSTNIVTLWKWINERNVKGCTSLLILRSRAFNRTHQLTHSTSSSYTI